MSFLRKCFDSFILLFSIVFIDLEKFYRKYINKKIPISFEDASLNEETNQSIKNETENQDNEEEDKNQPIENVEKKKKTIDIQDEKKNKLIDEENFTISFMESKIE